MREMVVIGTEAIGKTTLCNALLGWDIFPQSYDGFYVETKENASRILTDDTRLTDTPGYDYWWNELPEDVIKAVAMADTIVVLLDDVLAEEGYLPSDDPNWEERLVAEENFLEKLLAGKNPRDVFFVIPYDTDEWPGQDAMLPQAVSLARKRFSYLSEHGEDGFFCVDPMKALIGAIEADDEAVKQSGILPLKTALLDREENF